MKRQSDGQSAEDRFAAVFAHLGAITAYARRRGSRDPDGVAAEVMTIAWRRLADVPRDDALPWLYATARNLVMADARKAARANRAPDVHEPERIVAGPELSDIDPELWQALRSLSPLDQEALLLVAWEDLTPGQAASALGINPAAFRVRLLRARRRMQARLENRPAEDARFPSALAHADMEGTR
jgi:RNA polymerase sigma-70 factor (ECF subfamily)